MKKPKWEKRPKDNKQEKEQKPWRIYVSGFLDWPAHELEAQNFDKWRCLENPSGRLMIGKWWKGGAKPDASNGPLAKKLAAIKQTADGRPIEWTFDVLPVVWGIGREIPARSFDVVINLGLGVYDNSRTVFLEQGAFNGRSGQVDAVGKVPGKKGGLATVISKKTGKKLTEPKKAADRIKASSGKSGAYTIEVKRARKKNNFICNETHFLMLKQVKPKKRLRRAFFIHIAKPKRVVDYSGLADALAKTIEKLAQP